MSLQRKEVPGQSTPAPDDHSEVGHTLANTYCRAQVKSIRSKGNGHLAERISVLALRRAAELIHSRPAWTDQQIADTINETTLTRRSVNNLRRICFDTPQHLEEVLTGRLSLQQALKLRKAGRTQQ
jgi:hypothetical protein